jgi:tRNA pseudouridine55 synthase
MPKRYTARFELGLESESADTERECRTVASDAIPTNADLVASIERLIGTIPQKPPRFSAIRINGRRAYRLAHRGRDFDVPTRDVTIHSNRLIRYDFPVFEIEVVCGTGTYIRSLGLDIAGGVGTKCVMLELCRDAIGPFDLSHCATVDDLLTEAFREKLVDPLAVLSDVPVAVLPAAERERIGRGMTIEYETQADASELAVTDERGRLYAVMRPASDGAWRPAINFSNYWRNEFAEADALARPARVRLE